MRIPFDSVSLAAVVAEIETFVGGRVQGIRQPDAHTLSVGVYAAGREAMLLLSCHPQFARVHFAVRRPPNQAQPPALCAALRARIDGGRLVRAEQIGLDRILVLSFEHETGTHHLVGEFMGKHSNLMLLDGDHRILAVAKTVGRSKSSRPIVPGHPYAPPPFEPRPPFTEAHPSDDLALFQGVSPFLARWIDANGLQAAQEAVVTGQFAAELVPGSGAYPLPLSGLGLKSYPRESLSVALEQHYDAEVLRTETEALRASILGQLRRVVEARDTALKDLAQAEAAGRGAPKQQLWGELILAYGPSLEPGASTLEAWDYEGNPVTLRLDPELDFQANANRYFEKAKKAKARMGFVRDQIERLTEDRAAIEALTLRVESEPRLDRLRDLHAEALGRRWLNRQLAVSGKGNVERAYEGYRVREVIGPGGHSVLFGENAEANDYLTQRVAKPNDLWLHVRGQTSAHVIVPTSGKPERVGREVIEFAARIAVLNSTMKHSGHVPVDYTLKKYVRKPRGAAKGTVLYTHEKTIHVDPK